MAERNLNCDWKQYMKEHTITVEEAAKKIEPGDVIWLGEATCIPYVLLTELYNHKEDYHDVSFWYNVMNDLSAAEFLLDHDVKKHFRLMNIYNLPLDRMAIDAHTIEVLGASYDSYEACMWEHGVNGYAHTFCPPDENGWVNAGDYGACTAKYCLNDKRMRKKFAFIDSTGIFPAPGSKEHTQVHITDFDYIVMHDTEMMELPTPVPTEIDEKVCSYIMPYIHPGDKLQVGYGGLGEAILANLKNLDGSVEVFSEVLCDSMIPLVESGKISKLRASSPGACTEETFRYLSTTDKDVTLYNRDLCIEPLGIMEQDNIVAVNSTFMVDLLGQCCSEAQGLKPYTGMGGSLSYLYGVQRIKGGRSFICLRSTYKKDGEVKSNIVPWLPAGCIVSFLKNYVMFIVSEWGVADIYLKTYSDRIKALIKIAHPDFREWLKEQILTTPLIEEDDFKDYDMFDGKQPEPRLPYTNIPHRQYHFPHVTESDGNYEYKK